MIDERVNFFLQLQFGLPSAANSENRFCGYNLVFCSLQFCETQTCVKCVSEEFHLKQKRIVALDKNVFETSKKVQGEQLHSETSKKVTQFLIGVNEDEIVQQQLIIANAKAKVQQAMDGLAQNIIQGAAYSKKVDSIVSDINCNSGQKNFIPVIYKEPYSQTKTEHRP